MKAITLILVSFLFILSGCSSLEYRLHKNPFNSELKNIELKKSQKVLVLEQTRGFIWGGLYPGVVSFNPDIVKVENITEGRTTYVYIQALNIGETTLSYIPIRFNPAVKNNDPNHIKTILENCENCFKIKVKD